MSRTEQTTEARRYLPEGSVRRFVDNNVVTIGVVAGGLEGAAAGAALGAGAGSIFPGAGNIVGGVIGGVLGACGGGYAGKRIVQVTLESGHSPEVALGAVAAPLGVAAVGAGVAALAGAGGAAIGLAAAGAGAVTLAGGYGGAAWYGAGIQKKMNDQEEKIKGQDKKIEDLERQLELAKNPAKPPESSEQTAAAPAVPDDRATEKPAPAAAGLFSAGGRVGAERDRQAVLARKVERFKCSASKKIMRTPVLANDECRYERSILEAMLDVAKSKKEACKSPINPSVVLVSFTEDAKFKEIIDEFFDEHPELLAPAVTEAQGLTAAVA